VAEEPAEVLRGWDVPGRREPAEPEREDEDEEHADDEDRHREAGEGERGGRRVGDAPPTARGEHSEGHSHGDGEGRRRYDQLEGAREAIREVAGDRAVVDERGSEVAPEDASEPGDVLDR